MSTPSADKSLALPGRKQVTATEGFEFHILFIIIIGGILVLFIYITRLASNEIFSPSNKIHREVGQLRTYQHICTKDFVMSLLNNRVNTVP